jgi:small subunit ribosomal protein S4
VGRYIRPKCRLCRREGIKLMLKGARCETAKCPMEKQWRNVPPGQHNWRRSRGSEYRVRLREKQKVKRYYGLFEKQFLELFHQAENQKGNTGSILLTLLESRLDNVVHKLGFAQSRAEARVTIAHGHIHVDGRSVRSASFRVRVGNTITVKDSEKTRKKINAILEELGDQQIQGWLSLDKPKLTAQVLAQPARDDVMIPVEEQLIVEFCSR